MARVTQEAQAETRKKLLFSAADEFAQNGLQAANINRISLAAGLAKGTVYNYFASKEELFYAVVEEACRLAVSDAKEDPQGTTRERLLALIASDIAWFERHPAFARVFLREFGDSSVVFDLYKLFASEAEQAEVAGYFRAGARDGQPFGYGHAKQLLAAKIDAHFADARARYAELQANPERVEDVLRQSAAKARALARATVDRCKRACGLR